jgi:hypothetical protein
MAAGREMAGLQSFTEKQQLLQGCELLDQSKPPPGTQRANRRKESIRIRFLLGNFAQIGFQDATSYLTWLFVLDDVRDRPSVFAEPNGAGSNGAE